MGVKKLNEVEIITNLSDDAYLTVVGDGSDGKTLRIKVSDFETARAATIATKVMAQMAAGISPVKSISTLVGNGGILNVTDKLLGSTPTTGVQTVLLIAPILDADTTAENWTGMVGRIFAMRGNTGYSPSGGILDLSIAKAYKNTSGAISSTSTSYSLGRCTYNDTLYLAMKLPASSGVGLWFTGKHSGNCIFSVVNLSVLSDWTDL